MSRKAVGQSAFPSFRATLRSFDAAYWAIVAALLVSTLGVNTMPMLVGSVSDSLHINTANVGLLASCELGAVAFSCLLVVVRVSRVPRHRMAIVGGLIAAAGHSSIWLIPVLTNALGHIAPIVLNGQQLGETFAFIILTRVVAGIGEGIVLAAMSAALASTADPDRIYARALIMSVSAIGLLSATLIPKMTAMYSYLGTFSSLGFVTAACVYVMRKLPDAQATQESGSQANNTLLGMLLITSLATYALGEGAAWAFTERLGENIGLNFDRIGELIGIGTASGVLVGGGVAATIGARYGRTDLAKETKTASLP